MQRVLFFLAMRYAFSPLYSPTLRAVRWAAVLVVMTSMAAGLIVLSAFNGIEVRVLETTAPFESDLKILPEKGKFLEHFTFDSLHLHSGAEAYFVVEQNILVDYQDHQQLAVLKGIPEDYLKEIQKNVAFHGEENSYFVYLTRDLKEKLRYNGQHPLQLWSLGSGGIANKKDLKKALKQYPLWTNGYFIAPPPHQQQIWIEESLAHKVLGLDSTLFSSIEVFVEDKKAVSEIKKQLEDYFKEADQAMLIQDRAAQNALFHQITAQEKRLSWAFIGLIILLSAFALVVLQILILFEKKTDRLLFAQMGLTKQQIHKIFVQMTLLLSGSAALVGLVLALLFLIVQIHFPFFGLQDELNSAFPFAIVGQDIALLGLLFSSIMGMVLAFPFIIKK